MRRILSEGDKETGLSAFAGVEFEWFNYLGMSIMINSFNWRTINVMLETPKSLVTKDFLNLEHITPGMFGYSLLRTTLFQEYFHDIFDQIKLFGIQVEGLHTETGRYITR